VGLLGREKAGGRGYLPPGTKNAPASNRKKGGAEIEKERENLNRNVKQGTLAKGEQMKGAFLSGQQKTLNPT